MLIAASLPALAAETPRYGAELQGFDYPHEVKRFNFESQGISLQMAYMDVQPEQANGRTVLLMHGKNFCAATWEGSIKALSETGYRVVAADQIGFCKSSKPSHYQYSFQQLASNTHALLEQIGVDKVTVMGHSMGGMLATRYALLYPDQVEQLVMVNPIAWRTGKPSAYPTRASTPGTSAS